MTFPGRSIVVVVGLMLLLACGRKSEPHVQPKGGAMSTETKVLDAGADALQTRAPLRDFNLYLDGFHPLKANPGHAMEAHHVCKQVNKDFAQCVLFDGNTADANLIGVEYIISERLFKSLPAKEKAYWHPTTTRSSRGSSSCRVFPTR